VALGSVARYSFLWSQIRLIIAAVALFLGGKPPLFVLFGGANAGAILWPLVQWSWVISGVASLYLLYRWNLMGQKVFGTKDRKDTTAFFVSVVSGINLGLAAVIGRNIGMSISSNYIIFIVVGVIYLLSYLQLQKGWKKSGQKIF
jgi:uncharacterized membrane protein